MEAFFKTASLVSLIAIVFQDLKERKVSLYLFILSWTFLTTLYYQNSISTEFLVTIATNLALIIFIFGILLAYTRFKLKQPLFEVFGFGDALFFLVLACGFPTPTFIVLFVGSLIFALLLFLILKPKLQDKTVPLAGLQALFLVLVFSMNWLFNLVNLYQ